MIQVVSIPINHLFPAGAENIARKIQAAIPAVCDNAGDRESVL